MPDICRAHEKAENFSLTRETIDFKIITLREMPIRQFGHRPDGVLVPIVGDQIFEGQLQWRQPEVRKGRPAIESGTLLRTTPSSASLNT